MFVLTWFVFDLTVLTTAAAATTDGDAVAARKLGGVGDEYDDVPLVHLVQFGLLTADDATPFGCSEGGGNTWYDEDVDGGGKDWYAEDVAAGGWY